MYNPEINSLETTGVDFQVAGRVVRLRATVVGHMLDGKAVKLFNGLGGAYCDLCHFSKNQCTDKELILVGFRITRNINEVQNFFADKDNLDEDGQVIKKAGDYWWRIGITQRPITEQSIHSTPVLHTLLRTFDHFMEVVVHTKAGVFKWSASSRETQFIDKAKVIVFQINSKRTYPTKFNILFY